jgi:hypothetical protein
VADAGDTPVTVMLVVDDRIELVVGRLAAAGADLRVVDELARLRLAAGRCGWELRLRDVPADLRGLLELVGLAGVLGLEARWEPELGEQVAADEVMERGDAAR